MPRILVLLLLLCGLLAGSVHAASIADRSPIRPGIWWNAQRAGNGFEIYARPGEIAAIWFTYARDGRPVWYSAQGTLGATGSGSMDLLRHRWSDGHYAGATVVGSLRIDIIGNESIAASWQVDGADGRWSLVPFAFGGASPEIDRSGIWFDPTNSGWGLTLAEQGQTLAASLYAYDASGAPVWFTGSGAPASSLELRSYRGACPACEQQPSSTLDAARLQLVGDGDTQLSVAAFSSSTTLASGLAISAARVQQLTLPASARAADRQLARFDTESRLREYLLPALETQSPYWGTIDFSPPPAHTTFSATNLQEGDVDEADLVKTDGHYAYTFDANPADGALAPGVRCAELAADGKPIRIAPTLPLSNREAGAYLASAGLYLADDRLVAVTGTLAASYGGSPWADTDAWGGGSTRVEIFDRSNPLAPRSLWFARFDGHLVASRRIGARLVLVIRNAINLPGIVRAPISDAQRGANRRLFDATSILAMLPRVALGYGNPLPLVEPGAVLLPPPGAQDPRAQYVTVVSIALDTPGVESALALVGPVEAVYASSQNLYLASARFATGNIGLPGFRDPALAITDLHQVAIGGNTLRLVGSGSVEGYLGRNPDLAPLRLDEFAGRLRVVTSSAVQWGGQVVNRLSILEPSTRVDGLLRTLAVLPNAQRPQPLGKPGEILYGTRFVDDRLYAVTFQTIDPLYVVDLANPADPRIAGSVVLPGFSDYLHALPGGLLLGVGLDARQSGNFALFQGVQLNLFDVGDPGAPVVLQRVLVGKRGSTSALLRHPHAYSQLQAPGATLQFALPARVHDGEVPQYGDGDWAWYPWSWSGLLRYELRGSGASARLAALPSMVIERSPGNTPGIVESSAVDPASARARSVLFAQGTLYVGNGRFWHLDAAGVQSGPL